MLFKSLLLLSFLVTIAARKIRIENKCDNDVWIYRHIDNSTDSIVQVRAGSPYWYDVEDDGKWFEMLIVKTGCNNEFTDCDTGEYKPRRLANKNCFHASVVTQIVLQTTHSQEDISNDILVDTYAVFIDEGYSVPIEVSVDSKGNNCESILCNMTLDECPRKERNGAGDLRVEENGRVVACMAPCVTETRNGTCECTTKDDTKYDELMDSKCPSEHNIENFNIREAVRECPKVESMRIVMCP